MPAARRLEGWRARVVGSPYVDFVAPPGHSNIPDVSPTALAIDGSGTSDGGDASSGGVQSDSGAADADADVSTSAAGGSGGGSTLRCPPLSVSLRAMLVCVLVVVFLPCLWHSPQWASCVHGPLTTSLSWSLCLSIRQLFFVSFAKLENEANSAAPPSGFGHAPSRRSTANVSTVQFLAGGRLGPWTRR